MIVATSDRLFIAAPAPDWLPAPNWLPVTVAAPDWLPGTGPAPDWLLWTAGTPSDWLLLMTAAVAPVVESCCTDLPLADFSVEYLKIIRLRTVLITTGLAALLLEKPNTTLSFWLASKKIY
jgi:hypothetical protein